MDPLDVLIINARGQLGCSGLRNLRDLAQMRQETIEKRFTGAQHLLTVRNTLSIYAAWLWAKAFYEPPKDLHRVMEKWCAYLWGIGCTREMARIAWTEAQVMLGPMSVTESSPLGALHMKIGSSITMQFPTASLNKRKISVLQECASHEKQAIKKTTHQEAPLPSAKKHKSSHVSRIILPGSPFRQTVHVCSPSVHASRQGFLSLSPDNKDLRSHSSQNAARRAQEEGEVSRGLAGFHFHFGLDNASRPSVGGSHWSPRQDVARDSQRRGENRSASQIHRWPAPSRVEEGIPMSPPWAVSVRHTIAPPVPPKQKQTQKQRQINNIQNQLIKHENASVSQKKASEASKKPRGPTKDVPVAKAGQSSIAKFGALAAEANTQSTHSSIIRHEDESGRLSPWEEDEYVVEIPRQATSTVVQAKLSNPPLPMKPASLGNTSGATKKVSLGHFGTPKGILKPDNKKDRPPHQSCIPSAPALPAQQNVQHHAQSHFQHQAPIHPHYTQHHLPHLTQHHALNPNDPGVRVAPYPRMHSSPLSQHPILLQQQRGAYKPLIGYHPGVTRLFRRRPNVWVHQMSRDVALDTWGDFSDSNPPQVYSSWVHQVSRDFALNTSGDFSDSNQPQEYRAWEEYDPLNPLV